jgi:hypothetical protein
VDVEAVGARTPDDGAVVTRKFAVRAAAVESDATNAASVVVSDPLPVKTKKLKLNNVLIRRYLEILFHCKLPTFGICIDVQMEKLGFVLIKAQLKNCTS